VTGRARDAKPANVLPTTPSTDKPPPWPLGTASKAESALWRDLWGRPAAHLWRSQFIAPIVPARYVRALLINSGNPSLVAMESALGLTPASLARMRVTFADPRPHLDDEAEDVLAKARERRARSA
jgi:hypothetical protein